MAEVHISESEAARDFAGLLARVRAGAEIVIDNDTSSVVVSRLSARPAVRLLSECLERARSVPSDVRLDGGFADDLEEVIAGHSTPLENNWE